MMTKVKFRGDYEVMEIKIGMDAEIEYVRDNQPRSARGYIGSLLREIKYMRSGNDFNDQIGADGSTMQFEIRPTPGSAGYVTASVKRLIGRLTEAHNASVIGHCVPLGSHIHFGVKLKMASGDIFVWKGSRDAAKLLDKFIGKDVLKMSGAARRNYRHLGEYREQPHGFEYRTPPSGIMYCPEMLKITLTIAEALARKIFEGFEIDLSKLGDKATMKEYEQIGINKDTVRRFRALIKQYMLDYRGKTNRWSYSEAPTLRAAWFKKQVKEEPMMK